MNGNFRAFNINKFPPQIIQLFKSNMIHLPTLKVFLNSLIKITNLFKIIFKQPYSVNVVKSTKFNNTFILNIITNNIKLGSVRIPPNINIMVTLTLDTNIINNMQKLRLLN